LGIIPIMDDALGGTRVLLAGDDGEAAEALRRDLLAAGCKAVHVAGDPEDAVQLAAALRPDAVVALGGTAAALRARLDPFASDAGPPVVPGEDIAALPRELERRGLRTRLRDLEGVVAAQAVSRTREAEALDRAWLGRLALLAAYRDDNTVEHTERVGHLAAELARVLGLASATVELIRHAAPLHDIGKVAIPDSILLKPGPLRAEEFEVVKSHAAIGARVLAGGGSELLEMAEQIACTHHERWDGEGYPEGLAGDAIPVGGRLVAVADTFDVLVHERPYRESRTVDEAAEEIRHSAGGQFDPTVVAAFEQLGPAAWRALSAVG
jgi:putative two-component system response regulator